MRLACDIYCEVPVMIACTFMLSVVIPPTG